VNLIQIAQSEKNHRLTGFLFSLQVWFTFFLPFDKKVKIKICKSGQSQLTAAVWAAKSMRQAFLCSANGVFA
jgi:hypothetical protein